MNHLLRLRNHAARCAVALVVLIVGACSSDDDSDGELTAPSAGTPNAAGMTAIAGATAGMSASGSSGSSAGGTGGAAGMTAGASGASAGTGGMAGMTAGMAGTTDMTTAGTGPTSDPDGGGAP